MALLLEDQRGGIREGELISRTFPLTSVVSTATVLGRSYNEKSDLWALGCILYELCELKKAFEGTGLPAIVMKITKVNFHNLQKLLKLKRRR